MDASTEIMVAPGAAIGANCIPCFDNVVARSHELNLSGEDIRADATLASSGTAKTREENRHRIRIMLCAGWAHR